MSTFAIIIPCYNESKRINSQRFSEFVNDNPNIDLIFADDGSLDKTNLILKGIGQAADNVRIITFQKNQGKGECLRKAFIELFENHYKFIGYLDADLSTSLDEMCRLYHIAHENNLDFVVGSRIQKLNSKIERSYFRHIAGRIIATIVDKKFKFGMYDTQCGAKIFKVIKIKEVFNEPFFTRWLFDVEILLRLRKNYPNYKGEEVPLKSWKNVKQSKISLLTAPVIFKDLYLLLIKY